MYLKFDFDYINRARYRVAMVVANGVIGDSRVLKTAQTVSKLGYRVCLYGLNNKEGTTIIEGYPFEIVLLPNPRFEMERKGKWSADRENRDWEIFADIFVRHIQEHFKYRPSEFIHTHDMLGLAIGGKLYQHADKHNLYWIHDIHEYTRGLTDIPHRARNFYFNVEEKFIQCPDALTSVSPALNEILQDFYSLKSKPALVLNAPRHSDFDPFYAHDVRTTSFVPEGVPLIVYSGNVKPARGIETLVEALSMLPEAHVVIVTNSTGGYVHELKDMALELGVKERIHFHPYVPFMNVTSFLRTATIGVHPIQRYPNAEIALPNKLFEHLHAGLPSIVSNNHSMEEFVNRHDCGITFEVGNGRALAEAVTVVLERLHSELSWRQSIQALSEQYCWENQETVIAGIYDERALHKKFDIAQTDSIKKFRVLHLPAASAGQPGALAATMKEKGISASSFGIDTSYAKFKYKVDIISGKMPNDLASCNQILTDFVSKYDIFHFHTRPLLFSQHYPFPTGMDLILLRAAGKKVFFHFRGSEARLASVFKQCSPYNYVSENPDHIFDTFKEGEQRTFINYSSGACHAVFVTDPEIQTYVHDALIVPRVVDLKKWTYTKIEPYDVLRIVHAPSRPVVKGTNYILSAVDKLKAEGIKIDFRLVEGVPNDEARELYKWADVVIDQLRIGWYGVLAVEAMALGKAVVSYIRDDLKHYLPYPLPLVVANPDNLYHVLKYLAHNPEEVRSLGLRGRKYVEQLHDAAKVTDVLLQLYDAEENPFDVNKVINMISFQHDNNKKREKWSYNKTSRISRIRYINRVNIIAFFRSIRSNGVRVTIHNAFNLLFR